MKKFVWIVAVIAALVALDWFIRAPDSRARDLTAAIAAQGSAELKAYPYQFHVLKVEGDVAFVGTPRSPDVPAAWMIAVVRPQVNVKDASDPGFVAAQKELSAIQAEAQQIVASQPGIKSVRWKIDRDWLTKHGIDVPASAGP